MQTEDFIQTLHKQQLVLLADADRLILRGEGGTLNADRIDNYSELVAYIKARKSDLLAYLKQSPMAQSRSGQPAVTALYPLSPLQEGMLFHSLYDPETSDYIEQFSCTLTGHLDTGIFRQAWAGVVAQHSVFRTSFHAQTVATPLQGVHRQVQVPFRVIEAGHLPPTGQQLLMSRLLADDYQTGFDLERAPLMRVVLVRCAPDCHQLIWTVHHLVIDGWSIPIVLRELIDTYQTLLAGGLMPTNRPQDQYESFINYIRARPVAQTDAFWRSYLANVTAPTLLSAASADTDRNRTGSTGAVQYLTLNAPLTAALVAYARTHQLTVNTLLQATWSAVLSACTGQTTVTFGATVSGRPADLDGVEQRVGLFINTIPLTTTLVSDQPLSTWLTAIQAGHTEAREHQHASLSQIQKLIGVRDGLFDSILITENFPLHALATDAGSLCISNVRVEQQTNYVLTLVAEVTEVLTIELLYKPSLLDEAQIGQIKDYIRQVLEQIATDDGTQTVATLHAIARPLSTATISLAPADTATLSDKVTQPAQPVPISPVEQVLLTIWQQLLPGQCVGLDDDFFDLGGDSIGVIQVASRARNAGLGLKPKDVFTHPTIRQLAGCLSHITATDSEQGLLLGPVSLLPIQQYFLEQSPSDHFNQAGLVKLDKQIDGQMLATAVQYLVARHDTLRLQYHRTSDGWQQQYSQQTGTLTQADCRHLSLEMLHDTVNDLGQQYQQSLSLSEGPLYRFVLIKTPANETHNRLLMVVHHMAIDGVSWRILLEDLDRCLTAVAENRPLPADPKTNSYRQWATALTAYAQRRTVQQQLPYWETVVTNAQPLPVDRPGEATRADTRTHSASLSEPITTDLLQRVLGAHQVEINDLLLTALWQTVTAWTGCSTMHLGLEGHGREAIDAETDTSQTVGWFTNLFPVSLRLGDPATPPATLLQTARQQLRQIPDKGLGYSALRYLSHTQSTRHRLAQQDTWQELIFNYLGQTDNALGHSQWLGMTDERQEPIGSAVCPARPYTARLEVTACITNGQFKVTFTYAQNQYDPSIIEQLANQYLLHLQQFTVASPEIVPGNETSSTDYLDMVLSQWFGQATRQQSVGVDANLVTLADAYPSAVDALWLRIRSEWLGNEPLTTLRQQCPTIRQLARYIEAYASQDSAAQPENPHLVCLQPDGQGVPLFIIPGGFGNADWYADFALALGPDQPVYSVQTYGTLPGETPHESVEAIARQNVAWIQARQPHGPYRLVGHSFGTRVAYDMALMLEAQGEQIAFLGVIDAPAEMVCLSREQKMRILIDYLDKYATQNAIPLPSDWRHLLDEHLPLTSFAETWAVMETLFQQFAIDPAHLALFAQMLKLLVACLNMSYKPTRRLDRPICLLKADVSMWADHEPDLGWLTCTDDLRIVSVPGDHLTMLLAENATHTASQLLANISN